MTGIKGRKPPLTGTESGWYAPDDMPTGSVLYVDTDRLIKGLTPGAAGKVLKSNGLTPSIPSYQDDNDSGGGGGGSAIVTLRNTAYAWWEAENIGTVYGLADAASVSNWNDVTQWGRAAANSGSNRPTYETNEINTSLPVVRFDGSNDFLTLSGTMPTGNGFSVVVVAKQNSKSGYRTVLSAVSNGELDLQFETATGKLAFVKANIAGVLAQTTSPSAGFHLWEAYYDGVSEHEIVFDGASDGTVSTAATYGNVGSIGRQAATNAQFLSADVALLAFFARNLVAGDRVTIRDYVETKYGFTIA